MWFIKKSWRYHSIPHQVFLSSEYSQDYRHWGKLQNKYQYTLAPLIHLCIKLNTAETRVLTWLTRAKMKSYNKIQQIRSKKTTVRCSEMKATNYSSEYLFASCHHCPSRWSSCQDWPAEHISHQQDLQAALPPHAVSRGPSCDHSSTLLAPRRRLHTAHHVAAQSVHSLRQPTTKQWLTCQTYTVIVDDDVC